MLQIRCGGLASSVMKHRITSTHHDNINVRVYNANLENITSVNTDNSGSSLSIKCDNPVSFDLTVVGEVPVVIKKTWRQI